MAKRGRPEAIDDAAKKKLLTALRNGNSLNDAARFARVGRSTLSRTLARGKSKKKADAEYREFRAQVAEAIAAAKVLLVGRVYAASKKDPKIGLAILRARYPEEWSEHRIRDAGRDAPSEVELPRMGVELRDTPHPDDVAEPQEQPEDKAA